MEQKDLVVYLKGAAHKLADLAKHFSISEDEALKELAVYLENGTVSETAKGYMLTADLGITLGTIVMRKDNFAYVQPVTSTQSKKDDVRVAGRSLDGYIVGDKVYITVDNWGNGTIVGLYWRTKVLSGTIYKRPNGQFFMRVRVCLAARVDVHVKEDLGKMGLSDGDLIRAEIVSSAVDVIEVSYLETLAKASDVGADISAIIAANDAPLSFPPEVLTQAKLIPQTISDKDIEGREDYRKQTIVTIDGADALDFDDAVSCEKITNGYRIGVYIADVSYYVTPNTPLDDEASKRGTSIYVADRVVPMLPTELSNGICSLNPNVDRLVLSVIMDVDQAGNVYRSVIKPGVINSHGRLTYGEVNDLFSKSEKGEMSSSIVQMLFLMREATALIRARRERQGALDLDSTELKFNLDEQGNPTEVIKRDQGEGEKMIEDLMIIANVEVAKFLSDQKIPTLYRVHDNPPSEKIELFKQFLRNIKLIQDFPSSVTSSTVSHWYNSITDPDTKFAVSGFLLRSLAKAKYSPDNTGHFGLAEENYLHFTSPIRRYPDLIVHRTLRRFVFNQETFDYDHLHTILENLGVATSAAERRAADIEREVDDLESCKYMTKHIGEEFTGVVVGLVSKGMFLELSNGIEVFLAISDIDPTQRYTYSERHMDIQSTERDEDDNLVFFRLGSKLNVIISDVTMEDETVHAMTPEAKIFRDNYEQYKESEREDDEMRRDRPDYSRVSHGYSGQGHDSHQGGYRGKRQFSSARSDFAKKYYHHDETDASQEAQTAAPNADQSSENNENINPAEQTQIEDNASLTRFVSSTDSMDTQETKRRLENSRPPLRSGHSSFGRGGSSFHKDYHSGDRRGSFGGRDSHQGGFRHSDNASYSHKQYNRNDEQEHKDYAYSSKFNPDDRDEGGYGHKDIGHRDFHKSYGHSDYGHSDYGHRDSGHSNYGHSDYGHKDYGQSGYGHSDDRRGSSSFHKSYRHDDDRQDGYAPHRDGDFHKSSSFHKDGDFHKGGFHKDGDFHKSYRSGGRGSSYGRSSYGHRDSSKSYHRDGVRKSNYGHGGEGQESGD